LQHARTGVKQSQQMGHRKTAALCLTARLTKRMLQCGRVGHRAARAVEEPNPVPKPPRGFVVTSAQSSTHQVQQSIEKFQGQAAARLTIGFAGETATDQVRHMITGRVAVQDLQKERMNRGHWPQRPLTPSVADLAANAFDRRGLEKSRDIRLDALNGGEDKSEPSLVSRGLVV
jgi:hypothetical protein